MRQIRFLLTVAALALGCSGCGSSPAAPETRSGASLQLTITPNPIIAVEGTSPHPFASSYTLGYSETGGVGLTVASTQSVLVLADGSIGFSWSGKIVEGRFFVQPRSKGTMDPGPQQYVGGTSAATRPDGTLTVTFQYTDDFGNNGTASASAKVTG